MTTIATSPVLVLTATVRAVQRLSPSFVRITFGGPGFHDLGPDGETWDQRIKIVLPNPGRELPTSLVSENNWYADWLALPEVDRGHVRTYTARAVLGEGSERVLVVDFVLHGDDGHPVGPAGRFARRARIGDTVGLLAPRRGMEPAYGGIEFCPGAAQRLVLTADETAVPALASILEALPATARGQAVAEVPHAGDILDLRAPAGMAIEWIVRGDRPRGQATIDAVRAHWGLAPTLVAAALADLPAGRDEAEVWETAVHSSSGEDVVADRAAAPHAAPDEAYAWVAGDSDTVKAIRRLLVGEVGLSRHQVAFMGYWRVGAST